MPAITLPTKQTQANTRVQCLNFSPRPWVGPLYKHRNGTLHHGGERIAVSAGDCFCYLPEDPEAHDFQDTGTKDLVIWAFGNRFPYESPSIQTKALRSS